MRTTIDFYKNENLITTRQRFYLSKAFKELAKKLGIEIQITENGLVLNGSQKSLDAVEKAFDEFVRCEKDYGSAEVYLEEQMKKMAIEVESGTLNESIRNESLKDLIERQEKAMHKDIREQELAMEKDPKLREEFLKMKEEEAKREEEEEELLPSRTRFGKNFF